MIEHSIEKIRVIAVADNHYSLPLGVMLYSLLKSHLSDQGLSVYIIDGGISLQNKSKIEYIGKEFKVPIIFKKIDKKIYQSFIISRYFTHASYYKISVPELLDSDMKKAIYLDCDLIVKEDIKNLWDVDISEYVIAAVEDRDYSRKKELNIPMDSRYFNSGVMLINLEKWRQAGISELVRGFIINNSEKLKWPDQDGLNAILYDKWKELPPKWNQQVEFFKIKANKTNFTKEEFTKAIENPSIIHYNSPSKPWHYTDLHPLKGEFYKCLRKTPWKRYSPPDRNFNHFLKKTTKKLLLKLPKKMIIFLRMIKNYLN